ncbi:MAG TPA: hypothetical protein VFF52_09540 [Isosphaeraceae bacterium]|nr:hypothetical protein [Isosphaeraceae bacterium]
MKSRFGAACSAAMVVPTLARVATGKTGLSAHEVRAAAGEHFLEVGKTDRFEFPAGNPRRGKLVEQPGDKWVTVEFPYGEKPTRSWINLDHVVIISEEP